MQSLGTTFRHDDHARLLLQVTPTGLLLPQPRQNSLCFFSGLASLDPDLLMKVSLNLLRKREMSGSFKVSILYVGDKQRENNNEEFNSASKITYQADRHDGK